MKAYQVIFMIIFLIGCQPEAKNDIGQVENLIGKIENLKPGNEEAGLEQISEEFKKIDEHFQANRSTYSKEEIEKYNKTVGRFYAAILKSGLKKIKEGFTDFEKQLEGASEALDPTGEEKDSDLSGGN